MNRNLLLGVLLFVLLAGCTVVKPVTCAVVHPFRSLAAVWNEPDDDPDDEHKEMPGAVAAVELVLLLPLFWAYKTGVGAVGGLFSGFVSDLNLITGHASFETTFDTLLDPAYTNAKQP